MRALYLFMVALFVPGVSYSETFTPPEDQPGIQTTIEKSGRGDTILLADLSGNINEAISLPVSLSNDDNVIAVTIPLTVDKRVGGLRFDSVSYGSGRLSDPEILDDREVYIFGSDGEVFDSLVLHFSNLTGEYLPPGAGQLCRLWFTLQYGGVVEFDTLPVSPFGPLSITDLSQVNSTPEFVSGSIDISCDYIVGDLNTDGYVDVIDIVMLQKLYHYDEPPGSYPIYDNCGRADVNCDRKLDLRDINRMCGYIFRDHPAPCTCMTVHSSYYADPGLPDTIYVDSKEMTAGAPSSICIGITNDEPLGGIAMAFEIDGNAVLALSDSLEPVTSERISNWFWHVLMHADSINPDTFTFYGYEHVTALASGNGDICCPVFVPLTPGVATFRLTSWVNGSPTIFATHTDNAAVLPVIAGGQITVVLPGCGDANSDGTVNVADAVHIINYVFKGGPPPVPICIGNANGDDTISISDAVYLINYIFKGGPAPVEDCCPENI